MSTQEKKKEEEKVIRTDPLRHGMNRGKEGKIREMLRAWRKAAPLEARAQWRDFFEGGKFRKKGVLKDQEDRCPHRSAAKRRVGARRLQMVRPQVVEILNSWIANRQNEFRELVNRSGLDSRTRYELHTINTEEAWFSRKDMRMKDGTLVPEKTRRLARRLMRRVMARHRRPSWSRMSMRLDARAVPEMEAPRQAHHFDLWLKVSTLPDRETIHVPLKVHSYAARRTGTWCGSVMVSEREDGTLVFGRLSDMAEVFEKQKKAYEPRTEALGLDFGLRTLLATDQGDLLGRGWMKTLRRYDRRLTSLARHMQRMGRRPTDSRKYRELRTRLRGHVTSEVNRVLNRLVRTRAPGHLVLERLDFRSPGLSRRMNRLLQNCGRSSIRAKLADLEEKYGITHEEVNPAYTSQECSGCGYVDRRNRTEEAFECLWCGKNLHADVNGSRTVAKRRSLADSGRYHTKAEILTERVRAFGERWPRLCHEPGGPPGQPGRKGRPADPRLTNPYFREWVASVTSMLPNDQPALAGASRQ